MAKIPLTIDPTYCQDWGFWEGVRELVQNAKDADEYGCSPMSISHLPRTNKLVIESADVTLEARLLLLLGATTKRDADQRGKFGEGFAVGALALVRAGHPITIYNGDEVWRPVIEKPDEGHPFEGSDLLVFQTRKLRETRTAFTVEVENVSKEVWAEVKKLFLFLSPPKRDQTVNVEYVGSVLLAPEYKGHIFNRGIFVATVDDVEYGYDLQRLELGRDRKMVDSWDLRWRLSSILTAAHKKDPDKFRKVVYDLAKKDASDVKSMSYHADTALLTALREEFEAEHGENTVPVKDMEESKALETLGAKTVVVNKTLQELLEKTGLSAAAAKTKLQSAVAKRYGWSDLTPDEQLACSWVEKVTSVYVIVDFNDPKTRCRLLNGGENAVGIARSDLLSAPRELVERVASTEALRRCVSVDRVYLDVLFPPATGSA